MRKFMIGIGIILLLSALIVVGLFLVLTAQSTVASDEKRDEISKAAYGYQLMQQSRFPNQGNHATLTIWEKADGGDRVTSVYDIRLSLDRVVEQRWLKNDTAIYLELEVTYYDSLVSSGPVRILYDFRERTMHLSSQYTLWRHIEDQDDWLTDEEFDAVLSEFSQ